MCFIFTNTLKRNCVETSDSDLDSKPNFLKVTHEKWSSFIPYWLPRSLVFKYSQSPRLHCNISVQNNRCRDVIIVDCLCATKLWRETESSLGLCSLDLALLSRPFPTIPTSKIPLLKDASYQVFFASHRLRPPMDLVSASVLSFFFLWAN